ncbi:MAG: glycosyltransferase family 2 protein [Anaerolineaceae bacterium]|nr:glycosyltransferase family 2 protein [Anaerolineaceae bacterium]
MKNSISVVIPVYNSELILPKLIDRLIPSLKNISNTFEILLINDGSSDKSWQVVSLLAKEYRQIIGVNLMRNYGQHNALLCGIRSSKNDIIITMDDDLQHPPEEIHKLVNRLHEGFDVVYGIPHKQVHERWRNFFSWFTKSVLSNTLGIKSIKSISAFRAIKRDLRRAFENFDSPNILIDALLSWGTNNFGTIEVNEEKRLVGKSNYTFRKLFRIAMLVLTGFSTLPLRIASAIGFFFTLFGGGVLTYVIVKTFQEGSIPGFPFLASIVSIFSGVQLFTLGIFGEYLARIFNRSMNHPTYVIGETTSKVAQ